MSRFNEAINGIEIRIDQEGTKRPVDTPLKAEIQRALDGLISDSQIDLTLQWMNSRFFPNRLASLYEFLESGAAGLGPARIFNGITHHFIRHYAHFAAETFAKRNFATISPHHTLNLVLDEGKSRVEREPDFLLIDVPEGSETAFIERSCLITPSWDPDHFCQVHADDLNYLATQRYQDQFLSAGEGRERVGQLMHLANPKIPPDVRFSPSHRVLVYMLSRPEVSSTNRTIGGIEITFLSLRTITVKDLRDGVMRAFNIPFPPKESQLPKSERPPEA